MQEFNDFVAPTSARAVIFAGSGSDLRILLVRRKFPPYDGLLTLPGGYIKADEDGYASIVRKVRKETGVDLSKNFSRYDLCSRRYNQDPRGYQISQNFMFFLDDKIDCESILSDGLERPEWYYIDEVESLGFNHGAILCEAIGRLWTKIPGGFKLNEVKKLPKSYSDHFIDWTSPVVFFGGTFNPWHEGHQACLDLCPNKNIIIIPDANPWKTVEEHHSRRCYWNEYRIMAEKFSKLGYATYPGFFGIEDGNPTVDWLPFVECQKKDFLMGLDSFISFINWRNIKELIKHIDTLFVVPRNSNTIFDREDLVKQLLELRPNLQIKFLDNHQYMHLSSSDLRKDN